jgi:hypothetical protein
MGTETKLNHCPCCLSKINAVSSLNNEPEVPRHGDVTICCYCVEVLEFDEQLSLIKIRSETLDKFDKADLGQLEFAKKELVAYNKTKDGFPQQQAKSEFDA